MHIRICTDCHLAHHGYDQHELGYTPEPEPLALVQDAVTPWTDAPRPEPLALVQEAVTPWTEYDEPHLSWEDCQGCGSRLGGDRYKYHCEFV